MPINEHAHFLIQLPSNTFRFAQIGNRKNLPRRTSGQTGALGPETERFTFDLDVLSFTSSNRTKPWPFGQAKNSRPFGLIANWKIL